ncbi:MULTISPECIES: helix-turn-helix domain-containing protein [unclassified Paraburkholderia]|uniref:AraC-like ligand-binding domain-containing protein n=1 Tax=unclassified Paraburkholderia TaxID=2615204 RepID=UPI002AB5FDB6|nr:MULTISPECIES: helix-turn-helix domain-containing protein [unclassified Paraburkholderia]
MRRSFTTSEFAPSDRLAAWERWITDYCAPMSMSAENVQRQHFEARVDMIDDGPFCISHLQATDHVANHRQGLSEGKDGEHVLLSVQLSGISTILQDGRTAQLGPNDMVIYDASRPFIWNFSGQQYTVRFRRALLSSRGPCDRRHTAIRVPAQSGLGRIAVEHVSTIYREFGHIRRSPTVIEHLCGTTADLISAALSEYFNTSPVLVSDVREMHLRRAHVFISENLRDPALRPSQVAAALGISQRYLYRIFANSDKSISDFILHKRLDGCANWLAQPAWHHRSITDIAMSWGFNNAAHFSRLFRHHFGMSAREYRTLGLNTGDNSITCAESIANKINIQSRELG